MAETTPEDASEASTPTGPAPTGFARSRRLRIAAVVGGLLVAWTAFGFLVAPAILRSVLVKQASAGLKRDVAVAVVRVNPLVLSVTIEGFAVKHRDGSAFLGWESLYVRLSPLRMLTGNLGLAEIRLVRPAVEVGLAADGEAHVPGPARRRAGARRRAAGRGEEGGGRPRPLDWPPRDRGGAGHLHRRDASPRLRQHAGAAHGQARVLRDEGRRRQPLHLRRDDRCRRDLPLDRHGPDAAAPLRGDARLRADQPSPLHDLRAGRVPDRDP